VFTERNARMMLSLLRVYASVAGVQRSARQRVT